MDAHVVLDVAARQEAPVAERAAVFLARKLGERLGALAGQLLERGADRRRRRLGRFVRRRLTRLGPHLLRRSHRRLARPLPFAACSSRSLSDWPNQIKSFTPTFMEPTFMEPSTKLS